MSQPVSFLILRPGGQTALHDLGRDGYQHLGVPPGGVMDRTSAIVANRLVGNADDQPVLEMTLIGPSILLEGPCQIAITGADMAPTLDGRPLEMWSTVQIHGGQRLDLNAAQRGCRTYLAAAGTWRAETWMGSCSPVHPELRRLTPDSILAAGSRLSLIPRPGRVRRKYPESRQPDWPQPCVIEISPGPEYEQFTPAQRAALVATDFRVSPDSNRMGIRLAGTITGANRLPSLISSATVPGTIQVPPSGEPLILMRDAQTSGGYPRIGHVGEAELDRLAQLRPGDGLRLKWTRDGCG